MHENTQDNRADVNINFQSSNELMHEVMKQLSLTAAVRLESNHGWEKDIEVLVFLHWLAHAASYRVVSQTFDMPISSVHGIVHKVSKAVIGILRRVISFPTGDDLEAVGAGFAQLAGSPAFSRAVGAIDGCHIQIKPPGNNSQYYYNRKLFPSIQLQAITDHRGKFLDVFMGYPGSVHDSRVLRNSPVYAGSLYPPAGKCILEDGGYPCLRAPICLITPYREPVQNPVQARFNSKHGHTERQARFNSKHSRARSIVERAFGMMKTRCPVFMPEVVACCAVLHSLALVNGDIVEQVEEDHDDGPPEPHNLEPRGGEHVRDNLSAAVVIVQQSSFPSLVCVCVCEIKFSFQTCLF
uniref:DDE Tnp4 domain-containing protein n=1 Tax=Sinocyclocheilus grahami TaxID=75366 RepID=A0A672R4Z5_SINGR